MSIGFEHSVDQERLWIEQSKIDTKAFEPIYNKYYDLIFRFLMRRTDDDTLAADLCSQTFFKALSNIKKFEWRGTSIGPWLYQIASNELKKHFRNRKKIFVIEEDEIESNEDLKAPWFALIESNKLTMVLDSLNETELQLIELKYFEQLTFDEIAVLMSSNLSTVKMRLYRLLSKLRVKLEDHVEI